MKTVCKSIAILLGIIGFIIVLGTAGASDVGAIGIEEVVKRCFLGCGMMIVGIFAAGMIDEKENA